MKRCYISIILSFCLLFLSGCTSASTNESISKNGIFFDTLISIRIWETNDSSLLDDCFELCSKYENKFSRTLPNSEISKINQSAGIPVEVSDETIKLIQKGLNYSKLSNGAFDITIAPLSNLWDFKHNKGIIPPKNSIDEAKKHINYKNIVINGNTVKLLDPHSALDLGGIAKGYIADRLKDFLMRKQVKHAMINLGGNVLTIGSKTDGTPFHIGIQKPFADQNETIASIPVIDKSVVSSGIYERYFKKNNKVYHHLLDPFTGYPKQNNLLSVTIISDSSTDGDALSTVCYTLGLEKGMQLINQLDNVEAVFITNDYQLHCSEKINDTILK
ncbi:FAD:protein FMN transferase [Faecalimonas sp.]